MTTRRDTRRVILFRMAFGSRPRSGPRSITDLPPYDLDAVITALESAKAQGKAAIYYNLDGTPFDGDSPTSKANLIQVLLEDVVRNKNKSGKAVSYILRFSYANPKAADPGKRNLSSGHRETLQIKEGEAGDVGAHLVIGTPDTSGAGAGLSRCALEEMDGLSRSKIVSLIEIVAEKFMEASSRPTYEYIKKSKKKGVPPETVKDSTKLRIRAFVEESESLAEDLEHGVLREIRFIGGPKETDALPQGLQHPQRFLVAKVKESHRTGNAARKLIKLAVQFAKSKGYRTKLDIEKEEDGHKRHQSREIDVDKAGLLDQLFSRQAIIAPSDALPMCYSSLNETMSAELNRLLADEKMWK